MSTPQPKAIDGVQLALDYLRKLREDHQPTPEQIANMDSKIQALMGKPGEEFLLQHRVELNPEKPQ